MTELMQKAIAALENRGFPVRHAVTKAQAADLVREMIAPGASVGVGGSVTIQELDVVDGLIAQGHPVYWHWLKTHPPREAHALAATADVYLTSANAITDGGLIVNIDRTGNRVGAMIDGPKQVIIVAGANKLVEGGVPQAIARIKTVACPMNARRLGLDTPCAREGRCNADACTASMCGVTSVIERSLHSHPITVILVDEEVGY